MIVKELIEKLKVLSPDVPVLVQGYEGGFDDIVCVNEAAVVKNSGAKDWDGEYDEAVEDEKTASPAVVIFGKRR